MPGPLILAAQVATTKLRICYKPDDVASQSIKSAQLRITKLQRWRCNPRHVDSRWADLVPEQEEHEENSDMSASGTPIMDPKLTIGQTGQTSRQRAIADSVPNTPTTTKTPNDKQTKTDKASEPEQAETEEEDEDACCYYTSWAFKDKVTEFFEEPMSSDAAYWVSIVVMIAILLSVIALLLESLPELEHGACCKDTAFLVFSINEAICIAIFTIEYMIRFYAARDKPAFAKQPMNMVDLVAIIPFYLELMASSLGSISILRLFRLVRVFRVFKLSKHNKAINVCFSALYESRAIFGLMIFLLAILSIVFGSFEYNFEEGGLDPWGKPTPFVSIPAAMWWCITTVMMVGYGDMIPVSIPGKFCASTCIVVGIMVMALPISVIGTNFSRAWDAQKAEDAASEEANSPIKSVMSKLRKVMSKVNTLILEYNIGCLTEINRCHAIYSNGVIVEVGEVWQSYKERIHQLAVCETDYSHQQKIREHYVAMLKAEKTLDSNMEKLEGVCDEGLQDQFKRAVTNIGWISTCLSKSELLSQDVRSMQAMLRQSNLDQ